MKIDYFYSKLTSYNEQSGGIAELTYSSQCLLGSVAKSG